MKKRLLNKKILLLVCFVLIIIAIVLFILLNNSSSNKKIGKNELTENEVIKYKAYKATKYAAYLSDRKDGINSFNADELAEIILWYGDESDNNYKYISTNKDDEEIYSMNSTVVTNFIKNIFGPEAPYDLNNLVGANSMLSPKSEILETVGLYGSTGNRQDELSMFCGYTYNKYIVNTNQFEITKTPGCGGLYDGPEIPELSSKVLKFEKAIKKNDELIVTLKAIYLNCIYIDDNSGSLDKDSEYSCKVYKDSSKKDLIKKVKVKANKGINIKDYDKEASTITMKFKYNEDSKDYYFISSSSK